MQTGNSVIVGHITNSKCTCFLFSSFWWVCRCIFVSQLIQMLNENRYRYKYPSVECMSNLIWTEPSQFQVIYNITYNATTTSSGCRNKARSKNWELVDNWLIFSVIRRLNLCFVLCSASDSQHISFPVESRSRLFGSSGPHMDFKSIQAKEHMNICIYLYLHVEKRKKRRGRNPLW